MIGQSTVRCEPKRLDRYQRIVLVFVKGEANLNDWMVTQDWAVAFRKYGIDYIDQEDDARIDRLGIWIGTFEMPWHWRAPTLSAVVSRGGRPDLASDALMRVVAPTLLIVGGLDHQVIALNERAYSDLVCEKRLEIVPAATHLFEEPGTMEQVIGLASQWFMRFLKGERA
jgi:pimeloyl-ACP methyl ester carboxylesterase